MSGFKQLMGDEFYQPNHIPPFQSHSATSRDAAKSIAKHSGHDRQRVLAYLKEHPEGATDEAMSIALGLGGSTLRPRRLELQQAELIKDSGRYALTRSGRKATLWVAI
jgi:hypothetical protein